VEQALISDRLDRLERDIYRLQQLAQIIWKAGWAIAIWAALVIFQKGGVL
jgi:hypothetical protein